MTENDKPKLDERYASAKNSGNLTVGSSELPMRDADVLAAAAWSQSRVGHSLLQLHSEWDAAEKPPKPTARMIESLVGTMQARIEGVEIDLDDKGRPIPLTLAKARQYAYAWHQHEVALLLGKLKTLPGVRRELVTQVAKWGWEQPETMSARVLRWWLDQTCHACHGTKFRLFEGTKRQSPKVCQECGGSGHSDVPYGQMGTKLANWMDEGVNIARRRIKKSLQSTKSRV